MLTPAAIVTGATGGIGYATAEGLARAGRSVVLTGRDPAKGERALERLRQAVPGADAEFRLLDVSNLAAIAAFAQAWQGRLGLLIANAGVMAYRERRVTQEGFEAQFGTNYLGHFALTLRLLPALLETDGARVVTLSSLAHRRGRIAFDDLNSERSYSPWGAYAQSKLAMLMFARELQRRATERGWTLEAIAAHPGWSATSIVSNGLGTGLLGRLGQRAFNLMGQSPEAGALPVLYAALDPAAAGGGYYGPTQLGETRGPPGPSRVMPQAEDATAAERLWAMSEQLTGVSLPV